MAEYILRYDDSTPPDVVDCDNCGYPAPTVQTHKSCVQRSADDEVFLCEICYCTFLSNPTMYPSLHRDDKELFGGLAWIGNKILDEIRKAKPQGGGQ